MFDGIKTEVYDKNNILGDGYPNETLTVSTYVPNPDVRTTTIWRATDKFTDIKTTEEAFIGKSNYSCRSSFDRFI